MIDNIHIQNYRCYEDTFIKGFKKVNLIGGLNNAGKTILLEAILLNISPTSQHVSLLKRLRGDDMSSKDLPEYAWDNFFYHQNKKNVINIISKSKINHKTIELIINCDNAANVIIEDIEENKEDEKLQILLNDFVSDDKILKSVLHLKHKIDNREALDVLTFIAHTKGYTAKELNIPIATEANLIPASSKRTPAVLARDYGIAEKRNKENLVLKALQIVDVNIEAIKVSVLGGAHLEVKRKGENFMSVSLFGDAINKILNIILSLVNNESSILLIDEIENGIHYTVQRDFWKFIFELTALESFNNQVFATTHSLEMIKAFADIASKEYKESSAYFELFHRKATNRIDYNLHDLETFQYELSNNLPIRGE
jgi:AAA15 family ATPase/GTPase